MLSRREYLAFRHASGMLVLLFALLKGQLFLNIRPFSWPILLDHN